jgi:SAM-dependent methyltransferase
MMRLSNLPVQKIKMASSKRGINFGCGLSVGEGWLNYDASPTLRLQRLPFAGGLARKLVRPVGPAPAQYGDVVKGLPDQEATVDFVYCSHTLEHLALDDFRRSLKEVFRVLKPNGTFRGVLPDLQAEITRYLEDDAPTACSSFMEYTSLGQASRARGLRGMLQTVLGNSQHLWMWDYKGMERELQSAGFVDVRRASYGDSPFSEFGAVESRDRWEGCLGFECRKAAS